MRISIDEILRRLVLLGLPLTPLACDSSSDAPHVGGCPPSLFDRNIVVPRPSEDPDGGFGVTIAAWDTCAATGDCAALCQEEGAPPQPSVCALVQASDGGSMSIDAGVDAANPPTLEIRLAYIPICIGGRRPEGLARCRSANRGTILGRWLADLAALEAASVPAFRRLTKELVAHRAPARLVQAARQAARDEVRHFVLTARAARAHGGIPKLSRVRRLPVRSLLAMAIENAHEGCVRETFGAVTAAHQARHADNSPMRAMMGVIAHDEARHAHLAWQVDDWARTRLSPRDIHLVTGERRKAAEALSGELRNASPPPPALVRAAGLPSSPETHALVSQAHRLLWSS